MKTSTTVKMTTSTKILITLFFISFLCTSTINAQKVEVKGVVKGKTEEKAEPLNGVNIYLKDKSVYTSSNRKGEFTFPKTLNVGDVIYFSYLGYLKQKVTITKNSTNLSIVLKEDDNEMLGAVGTNKRFSSKRKGQ